MQEAFMPYYGLFKSFHLFVIIFWLGSMIVLPLILKQAGLASKEGKRALLESAKTIRATIATPAMVLTWLLGIVLIVITGAGAPGTGGWMHAKLVIVLILSAWHGYSGKVIRNAETNIPNSYFILSRLSHLLIVGSILLAVTKLF